MSLPVIDIAEILAKGPSSSVGPCKDLRLSLEKYGFVYISGHGISEVQLDAVFAGARAFHALPLARRMQLRMGRDFRGFVPISSSTIVTSSVAKVTRPNQSESLMLMHELPPDDPELLAGKPLQAPNRWPEEAELPGFRRTMLDYMDAMGALAMTVVRGLCVAFDLPAGHLDPAFRRPTTFLRLLHYPPMPGPIPEDLFGAAPHTDYGCVTLLAQDPTGGLEVRTPEGDWIAAPYIPGTFVMNVADILMRWTDGILPSTPHRVVNRSGNERYSVPFFFDPGMDVSVEPLPGCVPAGRAPRFEPVVYGDYLLERIDKNYTKVREPSR